MNLLLVWTLAVPLATAAHRRHRRLPPAQGSRHGRRPRADLRLCAWPPPARFSRATSQRPSATRCASTACRRWSSCSAASWAALGRLRRSGTSTERARGLVTPRSAASSTASYRPTCSRCCSSRCPNNLGILWIAVELTTLASVFLVAFHNRDTSLEAAWKFLGAGQPRPRVRAPRHGAPLRRRARGVLGEGMSALALDTPHRAAPRSASLHSQARRRLRPRRLRHQGRPRPDAHVEAGCVPRGALAGRCPDGRRHDERRALLPRCGSTRCRRPSWGRSSPEACCWPGAASVLVATPFILIQWNLKRLLAYSSIEHVGIMAIGFGLGGRGGRLRGAAPHDVPHARQAGRVLLRRHARSAPRLLGLRRDRPRHARPHPGRERACFCSPR